MVSFLMWLPQLYYSLPPKHTSRAHHKLSEGSRAEGLACGILPTHPLQSGDPVLRILSHLCEGSQCRSVGPRSVLSGPLTFCDTSRREKKQNKTKKRGQRFPSPGHAPTLPQNHCSDGHKATSSVFWKTLVARSSVAPNAATVNEVSTSYSSQSCLLESHLLVAPADWRKGSRGPSLPGVLS